MVRMSRLAPGALGVLVLMLMAAPALAQTGGVRGKVTDAAGKPVEGATVRIEAKSVTRKLEVKTNKKGEYIQIGVFPGEYKITAEKDGKSVSVDARIGLGDPTQVDIQMVEQRAAPNA
jgi:hypothetical protein